MKTRSNGIFLTTNIKLVNIRGFWKVLIKEN